MHQFLQQHSAEIMLGAAWLFSAFMSSMPPLPANASYCIRWLHDFLQIVAANMSRRSLPTQEK